MRVRRKSHRSQWQLSNTKGEKTPMVMWDSVTHAHVVRAIHEYDRLGQEKFHAEHGFGPTLTYDLMWEKRRYPPKAPPWDRLRVCHREAPGAWRFRRRQERCSPRA